MMAEDHTDYGLRFSLLVLMGLTILFLFEGQGANASMGERERGKVLLDVDAVDNSSGNLPAYRIETPTAIYYLEKTGAGLSSLLDHDGNDWLSFHPEEGSGAGGEYRGFPNAVHQQAGSYFHPRNQGTDPATTRVEYVGRERVTILAEADRGHWACRYDFYPTHCTFTMTRMPTGREYWVLYEGTPGGDYDDDDWWMTSAVKARRPLTESHEGDIPGPEWIAFGDVDLDRSLFLLHHDDDPHPDNFYQMQQKMTVFGFGREGMTKYLDSVPQSFSLGLVEATAHDAIARRVSRIATTPLPRFERLVVDANPPRNPWTKLVGDFDGDGRIDLAIAGQKGPLLWYRNPEWTSTRIADGGWNTVGGAVGDVDGDGDPDLVMGSQLWLENPRPERPAAGGTWAVHRISSVASHDVCLGDLDGDGRPDLVMRDQSSFGPRNGNAVHFWRQAGIDRWEHHAIAAPHGEGLAIADVDNDGDWDVVIPGFWYENDGMIKGGWRSRAYTTRWTHGDAKVATGDFNRDGCLDVALMPAELKGGRYRMAWYAGSTSVAEAREWQERVILSDVETVVHAAGVGDFNGDGWLDLATADMHQGAPPQEVRIHLNCGAGESWQVVQLSQQGSHDIQVADFNEDLLPDVMGANHGGERAPVEMWLNRGIKETP